MFGTKNRRRWAWCQLFPGFVRYSRLMLTFVTFTRGAQRPSLPSLRRLFFFPSFIAHAVKSTVSNASQCIFVCGRSERKNIPNWHIRKRGRRPLLRDNDKATRLTYRAVVWRNVKYVSYIEFLRGNNKVDCREIPW